MARRRSQRSEEANFGKLIAVTLIPVGSVVCGAIITGYTFYDRIATKPYVDELVETSRKHSDERMMQTLKEAYEHSDTNRREMMMSTEKMVNELKVRNAVVDTKLETILRSMQEIKDWTADTNQRVKRR